MSLGPRHPTTAARLHLALAPAIALTLFALFAAPPGSHGLSILVMPMPTIERIPDHEIEVNPCPPRCSAFEFARKNPSTFYRPIEPDEIVFEGETALIWGDVPGSEWLIWGPTEGLSITVWDSSMWVDELGARVPGSAPVTRSEYKVSKELRIQAPRSARRQPRGMGRPRPGVSVSRLNADASDLGDLSVAPPELLTPIDQSWLAGVLERLSKSQYAVGAVTLGLFALMARLVR